MTEAVTDAEQQDLRDAVRGLLASAGDQGWGRLCREVGAAMRAAAEMIQLHGAIGITWEHPAHRYLKRAHGALQLFGGSAQHTAAIAAGLIHPADRDVLT